MVVHRAMAQTSEDYWGKRMTEREAQWYAKSQQTIEKEMADYYLQAASRIRNDIAVLYARFATDNGIDKVAAQQLIQGDEYRVWRMEMKDYLKQVQITGDKNLLLELNTLAMRSRISRSSSGWPPKSLSWPVMASTAAWVRSHSLRISP